MTGNILAGSRIRTPNLPDRSPECCCTTSTLKHLTEQLQVASKHLSTFPQLNFSVEITELPFSCLLGYAAFNLKCTQRKITDGVHGFYETAKMLKIKK